MPLGIDPTVDYVFRMLFGDPKNSDLLIHLLNAVLQLRSSITDVEILNPFVDKEFADDKLAVLDIKARDSDGWWFNIEMQTTIPAGLRERLVYYAGCLYTEQLGEGEPYTKLRPVISICFLSARMFPHVPDQHLRFTLCDSRHNIELTDHFQIHTVELPKYNLDESLMKTASDLSKWAFFLVKAKEFDADRLRQILTDAPFQKAIGVVEMVSRTPEQRRIHDDRQKSARDYFSAIEGARIEGREEGREEAERLVRGVRMEQVQMLRMLLHEPSDTAPDLTNLSLEQLTSLVQQLQTRLSQRGSQ